MFQSVLGAEAVKGELNIVQVETKSFEDKDIKQPLFSLRNGGQETVSFLQNAWHGNSVTMSLFLDW